MKSFIYCTLAVICFPIMLPIISLPSVSFDVFYALLPIINIVSIILASIGMYYNVKIIRTQNRLPFFGAPLVLNIILLIFLSFMLLGSLLYFISYLQYGNIAVIMF